jgi:hypothetical protein
VLEVLTGPFQMLLGIGRSTQAKGSIMLDFYQAAAHFRGGSIQGRLSLKEHLLGPLEQALCGIQIALLGQNGGLEQLEEGDISRSSRRKREQSSSRSASRYT